LDGLNHPSIIKLYHYGAEGIIRKPNGELITDIVFILMEYVPGNLMFDFCNITGAMGEFGGRFFMEQIKDFLHYMSCKEVAHCDLKLENIMVTNDL
jgi:serine/threonine protein kinase